MQLQQRQWQLGAWLIDEGRQQVYSHGCCQPIRKKLLSVLVCLIEHYPNMVESEYLIEKVWGPYACVERAGINHAIWSIRQLLGESASADPIIETIPKRGYRLALAPQRLESKPAVGPSLARVPISPKASMSMTR
ncbi:winged helix-turn-helix domain-containing protein [Permianibacter aggregans]|uniref:Transcriptional regulator n=1 Tax=Permianibacter aggregans TaxID=1510150 RepID=A0A4R6UTH8_9GAMM|nr:winged helix-turn-helix domain-containing protein [Permianibacter aggregans]QGX38822.1 hypothetical protein E2H98_03755 [Permianibacter aggregans]TDQ50628.1 transcriptional regulator [Permianibacter aggregans]